MEIIDNFLDNDYFIDLRFLITNGGRSIHNGDSPPEFPWFFQADIEGLDSDSGEFFYMTHAFYDDNKPFSEYYDAVLPLLDKLRITSLIRVKANLYPRTDILHEHKMHADMDFHHSGAVFCLNTCDGYTKLHDGTKVHSVANRILLFDPSKEHCSTTTTTDSARFNINMNYIQM